MMRAFAGSLGESWASCHTCPGPESEQHRVADGMYGHLLIDLAARMMVRLLKITAAVLPVSSNYTRAVCRTAFLAQAFLRCAGSACRRAGFPQMWM